MRLAILTGGSRGLGLAFAETVMCEGFDVIEFSRSAPHDYSVHVDLASPIDARHIMRKRLQTIDVTDVHELLVLNNAATLEPIGRVGCKPAAEIADHINTNLTSAVLFYAAIVERFQKVQCRKVFANVCAGAARDGVVGWSLYCAAKLGMEAFVRTAALEQDSESHPFIAVNVDPGIVHTQMHVVAAAASTHDFPASERFAERMARGELSAPTSTALALFKLLMQPSLSPGRLYDVRDVDLLASAGTPFAR